MATKITSKNSVTLQGDPSTRYVLGSTRIYAAPGSGRRTAKKSDFKAMLNTLFVTKDDDSTFIRDGDGLSRTAYRTATGGLAIGCHEFSRYAVRKMLKWAGLSTKKLSTRGR